MPDLVSSAMRVARLAHHCNACDWLDKSNYGPADVDPSEWEAIKAARRDQCQILPGQQYLHQVSRDDGALVTFKARLDIHKICRRYGLSPEEWKSNPRKRPAPAR